MSSTNPPPAMPTRPYGRTGHSSSVAVLGAAAFWDGDEAGAAAGFGQAIDAGVNHLDIAPQYGAAQRVVGPLVPAVRDRLFVGCKSLRANGDGFRAQMEESLGLLGCDAFDLHQLHAVTGMEELQRREDGGAVAALLRARDEGLCRFVGITGHDLGAPSAHAEALRRHDLDTVMFPINARLWGDPAYRTDAEDLLGLCQERNVGVIVIKSVARRPWPEGAERHATTWYEPHRDPEAIATGIRFALSIPGVTAVATPGDRALLPLALAAAAAFGETGPMTADEQRAAIAAAAHEPLLRTP